MSLGNNEYVIIMESHEQEIIEDYDKTTVLSVSSIDDVPPIYIDQWINDYLFNNVREEDV